MVNARERRRYIRTETPIPVTIRIKSGDTIEEIRAQSKNISATGMMIKIERKIS